MSASLYARAKSVLGEVLELPPEERVARVDARCADDVELRAEVLSLLEHATLPDARLDAGPELHAFVDGWLEERAAGEEPARLDGALAPGARVGRFTLGARLGVGGMGVVFEASQQQTPREVALKLLAADVVDAPALERFRHEVEVLRRLDHPGVAALHHAGVVHDAHGPRPYFAMQLVRGVPLTHWVRAHAPSPRRVVELLAEVCDAVAHAHRRGVVHRDLKPANILVDEAGRPTVLDFGVARLIDAHTRLSTLHTEAGQVLGTLPYMSPEQVAGDVEHVDTRSDVYSLGALLFEALSGELPLDLAGSSLPAAALTIQRDDPRRLAELSDAFAGDLDVIADTALAKEPERRYADAAALGADLRRHLGGRRIAARPLSSAAQLARLVRRHRALAAGIGVALLALCVALGVSLHQTGVAREAEELSRRDADRARIVAAVAALAAGEPRGAWEQLSRVDGARRGWEWRHLAQRLQPESLRLAPRDDLLAVGFAEQPGQFVELDARGRVRRRALDDGRLLSELQLDADSLRVAQLSADGTRCAALVPDPSDESGRESQRVVLWDTRDGARVFDERLDIPAQRLALEPSGRALAWFGAEHVGSWSEHDGASRVHAADLKRAERHGATLRGQVLASPGNFGSVHFLDVRTGDAAGGPRRVSGTFVSALELAPDGARFVAAGQDGALRLAPLDDDGGAAVELVGHSGPIHALCFLDDGARLLSAGDDGTLRLWDLASQRQLRLWSVLDADLRALRVGPGGRHALALDLEGRVLAWRLDRDDVLRGHERYVYDVTVTADGRAVSASWDTTLRWWDLRTGAQLRRLEFEGLRVAHVLAAPDGAGVLARAGARLVLVGDDPELAPLDFEGRFFLSAGFAWLDAGRRVLVGPAQPKGDTRDVLRLFDVATGRELERFRVTGGVVRALAASPDERRLATGAQSGELRVLSWPGAEPAFALPAHADLVTALQFAPEGGELLSASEDGHVRVWDLQRRVARLELPRHPGAVWDAAWSPDGTRLVTACHDGNLRVFDARDGALLLQLRGHDDYVHALAFTRDGATLVSASGDGTLRVWPSVPRRER